MSYKSSLILGVMFIVAQGESEQKSASITWSVIERFKRGIPIIPTHNLLGYSKDRYGRIVIDKDEAKGVKYILNQRMKRPFDNLRIDLGRNYDHKRIRFLEGTEVDL